MITYSNFDSCNGWIMPGSGRQVSYGPEDYFMDENGDLWVPCQCQRAGPRRQGDAGMPGPAVPAYAAPAYNGSNQ